MSKFVKIGNALVNLDHVVMVYKHDDSIGFSWSNSPDTAFSGDDYQEALATYNYILEYCLGGLNMDFASLGKSSDARRVPQYAPNGDMYLIAIGADAKYRPVWPDRVTGCIIDGRGFENYDDALDYVNTYHREDETDA